MTKFDSQKLPVTASIQHKQYRVNNSDKNKKGTGNSGKWCESVYQTLGRKKATKQPTFRTDKLLKFQAICVLS